MDAAPVPRARWLLALACALPVICAFAPRDLWSPDEPRYGRVAHEMVATGDWMVPRFNGVPYPEKPPLVFWMQAGVESLVGGRTAVGARLPAALLAALATWLLARFATKRFGDAALGDTAAIVFATTAVVLWNSSRAGLDLPITAFGLLALEGGAAALLDRSWTGAIRFGLGIGLGLLAKGPHALYLPIGGLIGGAVWIRRPKALLSLRLLLGLLLGAALFAAWLVPALATHGDELTASGDTYRGRLLGQIGSRVSGEDEPHAHGPLFLIGLAFVMGLPWVFASLVGLADALRARRREGDPARFGLGAAVGGLLIPFLLLSIPASKRELYLIPPLVGGALLASWTFHAGPRRATLFAARFVAGILAVLALAGFLAPLLATHVDLEPKPPFLGVALGGLLFAAGAVAAVRAASPVSARVAGVALAVGSAAMFLLVVPSFDDVKSTKALARVVNAQPSDLPLAVVATSDLTVLWNLDRLSVERIPDALTGRVAMASSGARRLFLWKTNTLRSAVGEPSPMDVLWQGMVGGTEWTLLSIASGPKDR